MKRLALLTVILGLAALAAGGGAGTPGTAAGEPSLPAGHPAIPGGTLGAGGEGLPPGHPAVPGGMPGLTPLPPDAKGTLIVQAVQGTRGGPAVSGDPVIVDLLSGGQPVKKIEAKVDDHGQAILDDLPVGMGVRPEVTVRHAGADYVATGDFMHAGPPDHRVTVVVYESSEKAPAWVVRARHVFVRRTEEGLYVKDMMVVESPTDRAWLGRKESDGRRTTLELPLAKNTGRVDFYTGFHQSCTELNNGRLINHMALVPGTSQFQFGYVVPISGGSATLEITSPADTDQLVLVLPDDGVKVKVHGLSDGEPMEMGPRKMRLYKAEHVKAGSKAAAEISGLTDAVAPAPKPLPKDGHKFASQTLGIIGGGAVLAGGLGLICFKRLKPSAKAA